MSFVVSSNMAAARICVMLAIGAYAAGAVPTLSDGEIERLWTRFRERFPREYSEQDHAGRFAAFRQNALHAQEMNLEQGINCTDLFGDKNCVFGVTKFSDMFAGEFSATRLGYRPSVDKHANPSILLLTGLAEAPTSIDWRTAGAVTKVKDQGDCGSCWAFSTVEEVESQVFMATGKLPVLSTQQLISCDTTDTGCDGGDTVTGYAYVKKAGVDTASDYPDKSHSTNRTGKCKWDKKEVAKISGFSYATKPCTGGSCKNQNEEELARALASKGPVSICVNAADSGWDLYTGGIYKRACSSDFLKLDHCVQLVGYNKAGKTPYWILRNSYGTDWGIDGYMHLAMGENLCGVANEATIAEVASLETVVV